MSNSCTCEYRCSTGYRWFPLINESQMSTEKRSILYLMAMLWCFVGVALISDLFMMSIETITSKVKVVFMFDPSSEAGRREHEIKIWNDTVANLTLMALGTSAPEILLGIVEIIFNNFSAGKLGQSTIIGSASFNLFVISAICIVSIPEGEVRKIDNFQVYLVTSVFSILAYLWMLIVLVVWTPNVVTILEASITLTWFPILVITAYTIEVKFRENKPIERKASNYYLPDTLNEKITKMVVLMSQMDHVTSNDKEAVKAVISDAENAHTKQLKNARTQHYKTNSSLKWLPKPQEPTFHDVLEDDDGPDSLDEELPFSGLEEYHGTAFMPVVSFLETRAFVRENEGVAVLKIIRTGNFRDILEVRVSTEDGTAEGNCDYTPIDTNVIFQPGEEIRKVTIDIVDDAQEEPTEYFVVKLESVERGQAVIGRKRQCVVTIFDDDVAGTVIFAKPCIIIGSKKKTVEVPVLRTRGSDGIIQVFWRSQDITAMAGIHYAGERGSLTFNSGETERTFEIELIQTDWGKFKVLTFDVILLHAIGGANIGDTHTCRIEILYEDEFEKIVSNIKDEIHNTLRGIELSQVSYSDNFKGAMNVNGGDTENATIMDYVFHAITICWKTLFAFIPPTSYGGGWPTFFSSLAMIGLMTAVIEDLAKIFGCLVGIQDEITAITLVALGTSMPDSFASRTAALTEHNADSSVGNINGSNAVNVFLGLGLPWLLASIYWQSQGLSFQVQAKELYFSVIVFVVQAILSIGLILFRRFYSGGELGGGKNCKYLSGVIMCMFWVNYIVLNILYIKDIRFTG